MTKLGNVISVSFLILIFVKYHFSYVDLSHFNVISRLLIQCNYTDVCCFTVIFEKQKKNQMSFAVSF